MIGRIDLTFGIAHPGLEQLLFQHAAVLTGRGAAAGPIEADHQADPADLERQGIGHVSDIANGQDVLEVDLRLGFVRGLAARLELSTADRAHEHGGDEPGGGTLPGEADRGDRVRHSSSLIKARPRLGRRRNGPAETGMHSGLGRADDRKSGAACQELSWRNERRRRMTARDKVRWRVWVPKRASPHLVILRSDIQ